MAKTWKISGDFAEKNRFKAFNKKHPRELAACFSNLNHVIELLNRLGNVGAFQVGFFRPEGKNIYRIGQTGVKHAIETRLYLYVSAVDLTVYILTIGNKTQQADDILRCRETVRTIDKGRGQTHDQE